MKLSHLRNYHTYEIITLTKLSHLRNYHTHEIIEVSSGVSIEIFSQKNVIVFCCKIITTKNIVRYF